MHEGPNFDPKGLKISTVTVMHSKFMSDAKSWNRNLMMGKSTADEGKLLVSVFTLVHYYSKPKYGKTLPWSTAPGGLNQRLASKLTRNPSCVTIEGLFWRPQIKLSKFSGQKTCQSLAPFSPFFERSSFSLNMNCISNLKIAFSQYRAHPEIWHACCHWANGSK